MQMISKSFEAADRSEGIIHVLALDVHETLDERVIPLSTNDSDDRLPHMVSPTEFNRTSDADPPLQVGEKQIGLHDVRMIASDYGRR
jgi:hypothetical protein